MKKALSLLLTIVLIVSFTTYALSEATGVATEQEATQITEVTEVDMTGYELKPGDWEIGLSNSYYGNTWRKQMVTVFEETAEAAKAEGLIGSYQIQNGDNTVNAQLAQMNSFILKGVDAICINAVSSTALNSVIKKAHEAGIVNVAFDSIVSSPYAYTIDFDFVSYGETSVHKIADIVGEDAKVIIVQGVSGSSPSEQMYAGHLAGIEQYPNMEVVATVVGEASATVAQEAIATILPSLTEVDAVLTQGGGDAFGVTQAFEQTDALGMPVIVGDNSAEFIQWWINKKNESGYKTTSAGSTPSISSAAFWVSLYILNGCEVPTKMMAPFFTVSNDTVDMFADLTPGTIVSPAYNKEYVVQNVIRPYIIK